MSFSSLNFLHLMTSNNFPYISGLHFILLFPLILIHSHHLLPISFYISFSSIHCHHILSLLAFTHSVSTFFSSSSSISSQRGGSGARKHLCCFLEPFPPPHAHLSGTPSPSQAVYCLSSPILSLAAPCTHAHPPPISEWLPSPLSILFSCSAVSVAGPDGGAGGGGGP